MKDLDETIRHCLKTAARSEGCQECRDDNIQLAEWLIELKVRRMLQMPPIYSIQSSPVVTTPIQDYESIARSLINTGSH